MIKNIRKGEFGIEGTLYVPVFNKEITVFFDEDVPLEYVEQCTEYLINISDEILDKLCCSSIGYCESMRKFFDELKINIPQNMKSKEILNYISPNSISVENPENSNIIAFEMELNCDWEPEHGMEWIIRDNKVLYVGLFNGESEWDNEGYFKGLEWNYAEFDD